MICQCPDPEHDCPNELEVSVDGFDPNEPIIVPPVCTPCLYGCLP